jgi:hypothetical protein
MGGSWGYCTEPYGASLAARPVSGFALFKLVEQGHLLVLWERAVEQFMEDPSVVARPRERDYRRQVFLSLCVSLKQ